MLALFLALLACASGRVPLAPRRAPRDVATRSGTVRGYLSPGPRPHYAFLGVPYARAPVQSSHRFKAPEPPPQWDGIFEATHRVKCPQTDGSGEENCLVVNVFVPEHAAACCLLPVLVFVHDGGFQNGWGAHRPPSRLLSQGFVIVTFNYRLGVLGFLCLGTTEVLGNAGLKDQVAALYWVKSNIVGFGGNPRDVTVCGTGSGAAAVQLLLLSRLMKGLVHRVILDSESVLSPFSMAYDPYSTALDVAISLGYQDDDDTKSLERFFQEISLADPQNTSSAVFLPCVESNLYSSHSLIDQDPVSMLNQGSFDQLPMLIAYTNAQEISIIEENLDRFRVTPESFEEMLPNNLEFSTETSEHKVSELIKDFYFKDIFDENVIQNYIDYINDVFVEYPVLKFSTLYASKSSYPVYVMKFSYNNDPASHRGAKYGSLLEYIFTESLENEDDIISGQLVTLWSNFIKVGDPTPLTTSLLPVIWQSVNSRATSCETADISKAAYLVFDQTVAMNEPGSSQVLTFWDKVYEKFYKLHTFDRNNVQ